MYGGTGKKASILFHPGPGLHQAHPIFKFLYSTKKECGEQKQGTQADIAF